jgi:hypothetical protein
MGDREEVKVPLYLLLDLAGGEDWPVDKTQNPPYTYVDLIKMLLNRHLICEG